MKYLERLNAADVRLSSRVTQPLWDAIWELTDELFGDLYHKDEETLEEGEEPYDEVLACEYFEIVKQHVL